MKYFGTDGIRGIVNVDLTVELLIKIGRAISKLNIKEIHIGYDTRISNDLLKFSLVSGLISKGIKVIDEGILSTPSMQYYSKVNKTNCLMITASHNPYYYNGIKIFINGNKLSKEEEELIENSLEDNTSLDVGEYKKEDNILDTYINHLKSFYHLSNTLISLDLSNGALVNIANKLFNEDENITLLNKDYDGFNINENCGSLNIDKIEVEGNYLFSFDGDGDRILFKDKKRVYDGDLIVYLLAKYYKKKKELLNNKVVLTKNVNLGLLKAFKKMKVDVLLSDIGDKNVYDLMLKEKAILGGESSGHIINLKYMDSGDGLLNFLIIKNILKEIDIEEYFKGVELYPSLDLNLNSDYDYSKLEIIQNKYAKKARINIRRSGTEKVIRVNICSKKSDIIEMLKEEILNYE